MRDNKYTGILELTPCWDTGINANTGILGYWNAGINANAGMLECWDTGILGYWDAGMLELTPCWYKINAGIEKGPIE